MKKAASRSKKNVKICISAYSIDEWEVFTREFVIKLLDSDVHNFIDYGIQVGPYIDKNRNLSVDNSMLLEPNLNPIIDEYLFLDCDNEPTLEQVYNLIDHDYDVIGGVYRMNGNPDYLSVALPGKSNTSFEYSPEGVHEVDWVGIGCMKVKAEVFRCMRKPWFWSGFLEQHDGNKMRWLSEDQYFCDKARFANNWKVMADFDMLVHHRLRDFKRHRISFTL